MSGLSLPPFFNCSFFLLFGLGVLLLHELVLFDSGEGKGGEGRGCLFSLICPLRLDLTVFLGWVFLLHLWSQMGEVGKETCLARVFLISFLGCSILVWLLAADG